MVIVGCCGDYLQQTFKMDSELPQYVITDEKETFEEIEEDRTSVNLSNEGLTVVPATLFKKRYITKLDLSDNNIRTLPAEIVNLSNLKHLNLSRNGFRCTSPDDPSNLPREMKKMRFLEYLNISECNLSFIPSSVWEIVSLTSLDISWNKTLELPSDIGNLDQLKWLNAQHMGLMTLPEEIVGCVSLETLLLYGNKITVLPHVLAEIPNLKTLSINLRHMADEIDSNMLSLLQSGQIKSDHISNSIFNLPRIEKIELEYCKINFVQRFHSRHITDLLLSGNLFREIPECILELEQLMSLDLTDNLLKTINSDIVKMVKLKTLLLSTNNIEKIPNNLFEMKSLEILDLSHNYLQEILISVNSKNILLKSLNLSHNKIESLSETIKNLEMLQDLQLHNNKIKELPLALCEMKNISKIHQYAGLYKVGLWLLNNPIIFPAPNIWNTTDITKIYSYLEKTKVQRVKKMDPIRIILLGNDNTQKTYFLSKFLNKELSSNFQFLTVYHWVSENKIPFFLMNIDSNIIYSILWRYFIDDNSLIWLFINEKEDSAYNQIDKWVGLVSDSASNCIIQLVTFKEDSLSEKEERSSENNNPSGEDTELLLNSILNDIKEKYKSSNFHIFPETFVLMKKNELSNFETYKNKLEYQAIDINLFENNKTFWILKDKISLVEKFCKSKRVVHLNLAVITKELKSSLGIEEKELHSCLSILHKQGKLFWFRKNEEMSLRIYPFISLFLRSIVAIMRTDYSEELNFETNPLIRANGLLNEDIVKEVLNNFYNYGEISLPLYKILIFHLFKSLLFKDFFVDAKVGWTVPIPTVPTDSFTRPYLVFPHFNKTSVDSEYFLKNVCLVFKNTKLDSAFTVSHFSSSDSNEIFINLISSINCWAITRFDWENLCYIIHEDGDIILYKRRSKNFQMVLDIVSRSWIVEDVGFRKWLTDWYDVEFKTRFNSSFEMKDIKVNSLESPVKEFMIMNK